MPKDRDAKRKRLPRKAAAKTLVSRDSDDIRKNIVRREECVRPWASQLSTRSAVTRANRIKRKWHHQKRMSRERDDTVDGRTAGTNLMGC